MRRWSRCLNHAGSIQRGFVATEVAAVLVVCVVFLGILLATTSESRRLAMLNRDLANMRQIGAWTAQYANDFEDQHPSLSAVTDSDFEDIQATQAQSPLRQAVGQVIDIIRRRTGRHTFPLPGAWLPHVFYTHLVIEDYANLTLPSSVFVSTGDKHRLNWLDDPIYKHDEGFWQPFQNPPSGAVSSSQWRWPYSASFQTPPAWFDKGEAGSRIAPASHSSYSVPSGAILGGQFLGHVAFPAQKVMLHDYGAWHFSRQAQYFAFETARVAVLMGDGGASPRLTSNANEGWKPNYPTSTNPVWFSYNARSWQPPNTTPGRPDRLVGHYRWTRGGIKGRDFDGPEINTGQKR